MGVDVDILCLHMRRYGDRREFGFSKLCVDQNIHGRETYSKKRDVFVNPCLAMGCAPFFMLFHAKCKREAGKMGAHESRMEDRRGITMLGPNPSHLERIM